MRLTVHVKPGSSRDEIVKRLDETTLVVALRAPAREGKANEALVSFLAEAYGVSKTRVSIVRGTATRIKHVEVRTA